MSAMKVGSSVVIGGGRGFVGQALSKYLIQKGYNVYIISRSNKSPPKFANHLLTWDHVKDHGLPKCSAVVNLAGINIMFPYRRWSEEFQQEIYESRISSTRLLTSLIENRGSEGPQVYVTASAVGYYPTSTSDVYDEDSVIPADSQHTDIFCHLCQQWEAAATLTPAASATTRQVTIRTGVVLGHSGGIVRYSLLPFWCGVGGRVGDGGQWFPWIHLQDVVGIYHHAMSVASVRGALNGVSPGICTSEQFTAAFAKALKRPHCIPTPDWVVHSVLGAHRARLILEGQNVKPTRTLATGYRFIYTHIDSACREFAHLF